MVFIYDVINQCDVEWCQYGEQQQFGNCQVEISVEIQYIYYVKLYCVYQYIQVDCFQVIVMGMQKWQKNECCQINMYQYCKIVIDVFCKVFVIKVKGEGLQNCGDDKQCYNGKFFD